MPWQPFRRKIRHKHLRNDEVETSFDDLLPRSVSDGNLVRTPSERFLLSSLNTKSYGTCSSGSSVWNSFTEHEVQKGETLPGIALRYNITLQDLKVSNKLWTNEGLWPGRLLRIPLIEVGSTSLDLSGSSSDTMSTGSSESRRLSSSHDSTPHNGTNGSLGCESPYNLRLSPASSSSSSPYIQPPDRPSGVLGSGSGGMRRASVEDLQDFLSKMDSSIAAHKRNTLTIISKSHIREEQEEGGSTTTTSSSSRITNNNRPALTDPFHHVC